MIGMLRTLFSDSLEEDLSAESRIREMLSEVQEMLKRVKRLKVKVEYLAQILDELGIA